MILGGGESPFPRVLYETLIIHFVIFFLKKKKQVQVLQLRSQAFLRHKTFLHTCIASNIKYVGESAMARRLVQAILPCERV